MAYLDEEAEGGPPNPISKIGAALFFMAVGFLAAFGPARRGLRIEPTEALREQ
jgi:ABC-type antimicrobial peptide transport system permease subunit